MEDVSGGPVFDTAAGMFRAMRFVSGAQIVASRTATSTPTSVTPVNVDTTYTLASIPTAATHCIGMIQLVRAGAPTNADAAGRWQAVNGSKLDIHWLCGPQNSITSPTALIYNACVGWFTFIAAGGSLTMREELTMRAAQGLSGTFAWTRPQTTVNYRLFCGAFI